MKMKINVTIIVTIMALWYACSNHNVNTAQENYLGTWKIADSDIYGDTISLEAALGIYLFGSGQLEPPKKIGFSKDSLFFLDGSNKKLEGSFPCTFIKSENDTIYLGSSNKNKKTITKLFLKGKKVKLICGPFIFSLKKER
ncbi:MAG: hypothetical protein ACK504_04170 [Bacteroidota bacterium]